MPTHSNRNTQESRIDDRDAALEESGEAREEQVVTEEADANLHQAPSLPTFDLYINPQRPCLGVLVPRGGSLSSLADWQQWIFDHNVAGDELSQETAQQIRAVGYAFEKLD